MQGCVSGGDKPPRCRQQYPKPGLRCAHLNAPVIHGLRFMASAGSRAVPELPLTAPRGSVTAGAAWALGGLVLLAATPRQLPGSQPPRPQVPVLPQKEKAASPKPRPAPPCPHEPGHGDRTPTSDSLAVPLLGLS